MLHVRFAEMSREVSKALGVNVLFGGETNGATINGSLGTGLQDSTGSLGLGFDIGNVGLALTIQALENKGVVRTLAEPNLVALSGETAEFLAGGEFPFVADIDQGQNQNQNPGGLTTGAVRTIEFRKFGVQLEFAPTVVDGDLINLELAASVSQINVIEDIEIPALDVRSASTNVELRDGQSFAIAGLLNDEFTDAASQVPWIGDVPVIGSLFRSSSFVRQQSELVIIVTAHLVTPVDNDLLALPTDRLRIPSEKDLFLNGNVEGTPEVQDIARQDFQGSYGYVME